MTGSPSLRPRLTAALAGLLAALLPASAFAATSPDSDRVIIWTTTVVLISLFLCAVGYGYRRMRGMDHPTPDELEMAGGHGHDEHDDAVHPHPEAEHAVPGAAGHH
jgi:hypothetical protein